MGWSDVIPAILLPCCYVASITIPFPFSPIKGRGELPVGGHNLSPSSDSIHGIEQGGEDVGGFFVFLDGRGRGRNGGAGWMSMRVSWYSDSYVWHPP